MFETLTLALHLVCVCLAVGLSSCVWANHWLRPCSPLSPELQLADQRQNGRLLAECLAWYIAVAGTGLIVGWQKWDRGLSQALGQVGTRFHFAIVEYCFSVALFAVCAAWCRRARFSTSRARFVRGFVLAAAVTNLVYHFPAFFGVIGELRREGNFAQPLTSAEFRGLVFRWRMAWSGLHTMSAAAVLAAFYLLSRCDLELAAWDPRRLRRLLTAGLAGIWLSGWALQLTQPRAVVLEWYRSANLGWMLAAIGTVLLVTVGLGGVARGNTWRIWQFATWSALGLTFVWMAVLASSG